MLKRINEEVLIGEINFHDVKVKVYYDQQTPSTEYLGCAWRSRNPDSFYIGIMYMDEVGKLSYPKDAVIPEQTDKDREILPQFIITGHEKLSDELIKEINSYLESDYLIRNGKNENK